MFETFGIIGLGLAGMTALSVLASIAYSVLVIWMIVDGVLRADAEYPGTDPNRKVLWVVLMVLVNPVAIAYFFMVYAKIKRGTAAAYTCCEPAPPTA